MPQKKKTTEEFIKEAVAVHGTRYDYSESVYVNADTKIKIICKHHGPFYQVSRKHTNAANGCPVCARELVGRLNSLTTDQFIERAREVHGDSYDYSKVVYTTAYDPVTIICPIHSEFVQIPHDHLGSSGCPYCASIKRAEARSLSTEEYIYRAKGVHRDLYDYSETVYTRSYNDVTVICRKHGRFTLKAYSHLEGNGCSICNSSRAERAVHHLFAKTNVYFMPQHSPDELDGLYKYDFVVPLVSGKQLFIEIDGEQHRKFIPFFHTDREGFNKQLERDRIKTEFCKMAHGITLFRIPYESDPVPVLEAISFILKAHQREIMRV